MNERIDHAAEARAHEEAGLAVMREAPMAPHMVAVMQFDLARLHAQLALVEQQRIANMLALARINRAGYTESTDYALIREAREALGLA